MAALTLTTSRINGFGFHIKRVLPSILVNRHQDRNNEISYSEMMKSSVFPIVCNIINEWIPSYAVDLFCKTGILLAVPKKRVSHSRKRIRNFPKFPKNRTDIEICVVCRNQKLQGHLCGYCLDRIRTETAEAQAKMPSYDLPQSYSR